MALPAWAFVTIYGLIELTMGVIGAQASVGHFARLGGMLGAGLIPAFMRPKRRLQVGRLPQTANNLRYMQNIC